MLLRVAVIFMWYVKFCLSHEDELLEDELVNGVNESLIKLDGSNWTALLDGEWMVEFYAPWCPACSALESNWKAFAKSASSLGISVAQIDVTSSPGLSGRFMVTALPTMFHVVDRKFRRYKGSRTAEAFEAFIREKKWKEVEPLSAWKSPDSLLMTAVSHFFELSQIVRGIHSTLQEEYGIPTWGSYVIFAVGTIVTGAFLGLAVVFMLDRCFPPKVQPPQILQSKDDEKDSGESTDEELAARDELHDDQLVQENSDAEPSPVLKRRKARKDN